MYPSRAVVATAAVFYVCFRFIFCDACALIRSACSRKTDISHPSTSSTTYLALTCLTRAYLGCCCCCCCCNRRCCFFLLVLIVNVVSLPLFLCLCLPLKMTRKDVAMWRRYFAISASFTIPLLLAHWVQVRVIPR